MPTSKAHDETGRADTAVQNDKGGNGDDSVNSTELAGPYFGLVEAFIDELRTSGLPVSLSEKLDAYRATRAIDITNRSALRAVLGACLVKDQSHLGVFETLFELFFTTQRWAETDLGAQNVLEAEQDESVPPDAAGERAQSTESLSESSLEEILEMLRKNIGLQSADGNGGTPNPALMQALARQVVRRLAGIEPGRPVGGTYYLYKTLRQLNLDVLAQQVVDESAGDEASGSELSELDRRLLKDLVDDRLKNFTSQIEAEIRRLLVADRGRAAVAQTLRRPLPEDVDFMQASREEMQMLRKAIYPLTRKLAARLSRKRKHRRKGPLDFRSTVRRSLSYGGVLAEPKFRTPNPSKPEIFVIADISGSVASFARFTLHLVYALSSHFTKVRSFAFIDGLDEVTSYFEAADDFDEAINRVNTEADVVWIDGHSDYGQALNIFWERFGNQLGPKSTVLVLGDARNNYHEANAATLGRIGDKARKLFWLNPEPKPYWNTGDSIMAEYQIYCDGVFEARNLKQLERFVDNLA